MPHEKYNIQNDNQILVRLTNVTSITKIQEDMLVLRGMMKSVGLPIPAQILWDEGDLCTSSQHRDNAGLERKLFQEPLFKDETPTLWTAVRQNVVVTATICMPALTSPTPFALAILPVPTNYIGHSIRAKYRPIFKKVPDDLNEALYMMMHHMHCDGCDADGTCFCVGHT